MAKSKLAPERDDVLPEGRAPSHIRKFLAQVGGLNPYGEARYRLVLAQCVREWHGGEWWDWAPGGNLQDQGGFDVIDTPIKKHVIKIPGLPEQTLVSGGLSVVQKPNKPIRVVAEMRFVPKYEGLKGWILQRWRPASQFGSRTWWEAQTVPGHPDLPILGPFPEHGAYEALDWIDEDMVRHIVARPQMPDIGRLEKAIRYLENEKIEEYDGSPAARLSVRIYEHQCRLQAYQKKLESERNAEIADVLKPYLGSSLRSGALRTALAEKAGVREHIGN